MELNRAKVWPTDHITFVGQPCVGAFPKTVLNMCPVEAVLKVSNAQMRCKEETWMPDQVARSFLSSSSVECGSSVGILWILTERWLLSPSGVLGSRLIGIPTTLPQSGWFANHSKSFIRFSYLICAFIYHIVELVFVLSYIRSCVWGSIEYSGTRYGDYYLVPRRLTALIRRKILDSAVNVVSEALSMHVVSLAIQIIVVPTRVTVLLGLCNSPHSWTGMVGPSLPDLTIAPCVDSLLCFGLIRQPKSILQDIPKSKVCVCIYIITFELSYLSLG
jgi:hypothetical protein